MSVALPGAWGKASCGNTGGAGPHVTGPAFFFGGGGCSFIIELCGVSKSTCVFLWLLCFQKDVSHRCIDFSPPPPS